MATFANAEAPRYLVADAKLDTEDNATTLATLGCITRLPATLKRVARGISQALQGGTWHTLDDATRDQTIELCHDGMAQRWRVVSSQAALERAEKRVTNAPQGERETVQKPLLHRQAKRFETPDAAHAALAALANTWRDHPVVPTELTKHKRYAGHGRPTPHSPIKSMAWPMHAQVRPDQEVMEARKQHKACYVIGTNIEASQVSDVQVLQAYKAQGHVEGGFRFLKDPLFFVSSLFVKKPCRIQGLLMVMTLALLVYSVTQRRLRQL
jgi:transposase